MSTQFPTKFPHSKRGAVKSLARPASQILRTESIVSLERGVCFCADLQAFSCYRCWNEAYYAKRDFSNIETWGVINFYFLQRKAPKEIHSILTEIWRKIFRNVYQRQKMGSLLMRGDFTICVSLRPGW